MNKVILYGHLGADGELKMTQGGTAVLKLRLATSERKKQGDEWVDHTEWHSIVVWGKRAEGLSKYALKGQALLVEGRLRTSSWEDNDGNKKYRTEINADEVKLAGKRGDGGGAPSSGNGGQRQQGGQQRAAPASRGYDGPDDDGDEIPF